MADYIITMDRKGVETLRKVADTSEKSALTLFNEILKLHDAYLVNETGLGIFQNDIRSTIEKAEKATREINTALQNLIPRIRRTATDIENFLNDGETSGTSSAGEMSTLQTYSNSADDSNDDSTAPQAGEHQRKLVLTKGRLAENTPSETAKKFHPIIKQLPQSNETELCYQNTFVQENFSEFNGDMVFRGNFYSAYLDYFEHPEQFENDDGYVTQSDFVFIDARNIEGVTIGKGEFSNPQNFWTCNGRSEEGKRSLAKLAQYLPEIQTRVSNGERYTDFAEEPMKTAVDVFCGRHIEPVSVVLIENTNGQQFYEFQGYGRHRVLLCQELGVEIPVKIVGKTKQLSRHYVRQLGI